MVHNPISKALLAGAFLLAGSAAFARTSPDPAPLVVGIHPIKQVNKFCLSVEKQADTQAFVQLLTPTGEELYQAFLPKKGTKFRQIFDLNDLKDGVYTIRVKQGKDVIVKPIQLRTATPDPALPTRYVTLGE